VDPDSATTDLDHYRGRPRRRRSAARYAVLAMLTLGIAVNYLDRSTTSVALPSITTELHLSPGTQGILLSCFFWTYVIFMIPGGKLADRFGPRRLLGLAGVLWGLATFFAGLGRNFATLLGLRAVMGAAEAPSYPGGTQVVKSWFPKRERAFAAGMFNSGSKIGGTLAIPLVSLLVGSIGWRGAFMVSGGLAMLWGVAWYAVYRTPRGKARTSRAEIEYIEGDQETAQQPEVKLRQLFRLRTIHAMSFGFFCVNFVAYFFFTWFPTYLITTYHLSILKFGLLGMLPGIAATVGGWVGGWVSDALYRRGMSLSMARKTVLVVGMAGSSVIALAGISPTVGVALTCLCIANGMSTAASSAVWALPGDVAPHPGLIGSIGAVQNTASNLAGIVSPILIGFIMGFTSSFVVPLALAGGIALAGALTYAVWLPRVQPLRL
jgi:ACS family glucarate transporter-like MFS transporter